MIILKIDPGGYSTSGCVKQVYSVNGESEASNNSVNVITGSGFIESYHNTETQHGVTHMILFTDHNSIKHSITITNGMVMSWETDDPNS